MKHLDGVEIFVAENYTILHEWVYATFIIQKSEIVKREMSGITLAT